MLSLRSSTGHDIIDNLSEIQGSLYEDTLVEKSVNPTSPYDARTAADSNTTDNDALDDSFDFACDPYICRQLIYSKSQNVHGTYLISPKADAHQQTFRAFRTKQGTLVDWESAGKDLTKKRQQHEKIAFGGGPGDDASAAPSSQCFLMSEKGCVNVSIGIVIPTESQARKKWGPKLITTKDGTMMQFHSVDKDKDLNAPSLLGTKGTRDWRTKAMLKNARRQVDEKIPEMKASVETADPKRERVILDNATGYHARILVVTRKGNVDLNLLSVHQGCSVHLAIHTEGGNVLAFLPRDFHGHVRIHVARPSRHDSITILPCLAARSKIARNLAKGIVMLSSGGRKEHNDDDLCVINTMKGKVTVGLLGGDVATEVSRGERVSGILRRLFRL